MKSILTKTSNVLYVIFMLTLVFILFMIPKCSSAQSRFLTSEDFRGKMRGFNLGSVIAMADLKVKNIPGAKATGANHGRLWLHWKHGADNSYYPTNFNGTTNLGTAPILVMDSAIRMAEKINFPLIITSEFIPKQGADDWWGSRARKDSIIAVWVNMAKKYKDKKIIAAYDLMNEPRINRAYRTAPSPDLTETQLVKEFIDFQIEIINAIRKVDTNHVIVVEVLDNKLLANSANAALATVKNIVVSPHGYSYGAITFQGVTTAKVVKYPSTEYPSNMFSSNLYWKAPADFSRKYNIPIWVGEFSCINWAPKNSAGQWTSTRWIEDAIKYMESQGWSWAYHAWNEYQGWDAEIPSSFYVGKTFVNAAPSPKPTYFEWKGAKSSTAPTILMLKQKFSKNLPIQ